MSAIVLAVSRKPSADARRMVRAATEPLLSEASGRWESVTESPTISAGIIWRGAKPRAGASVLKGSDVSVLIDGFLSKDATEGGGTPHDAGDRDARIVADAYRQRGEHALQELCGSFVIVVVDHRKQRVLALTDRSGSRPIYVGHNDEAVLVAPEPKAFHNVPGMCGEILPGSILSLALNAFLVGESSYWRNVELLGPARLLLVDRGRVTRRRYWTPSFVDQEPPKGEELEAAVRACVVGHVGRFERPVLALSGGVDSRAILAAARSAGLRLDTVTWTYDRSEGESADFAVAPRIAAAAGVENVQYRLADDKLPEQASRIVYAGDGLCGFLGAFADREVLAERLADRFDAIVFGDQCYRGERQVHTQADALERVGVRIGPRVSLVRFLMRRDAARECLRDYRRQIDALLADVSDCPGPHDLHDRLYWQVRVPRLLTGPKSLWRIHLEALSPLLDVPMLDLAGRLAVEQRAEKSFLREGLRSMAPDLAEMSFSSVHSRTKWRRIFTELGPLPGFIVETLLDPLPAFDRWFDRASIEIWLKSRLAEARRRETVIRTGDGPVTRAARRVKSLWVNRAFNPRVVINLLTLKLWFHHFGR